MLSVVKKGSIYYAGGFVIPYPIDMLATAWLLGIANPQSIKRLGHFLTADCKSAGTPNGGKDISGATEMNFFRSRLYSVRRPDGFAIRRKKGSTYYARGFAIPYPIDMLATAWLLGIANPQSIKRLGHFLTADCKSAGTPNGGNGISGAIEISL